MDFQKIADLKGKINKASIRKKSFRAVQFITKAGMYLLPWRTPEIMRGAGSSRKLPVAVSRKNLKKPLIVTGMTVSKAGLMEGMLETAESFRLSGVIFDKVTPNPTDEEVEAGAAMFRENGCDCIIAFGGGSDIDCAKAIGAKIARPEKSVRQLQGALKILRPIPVLFVVPTTAGSGSETTISAVITENATRRKAAITDPVLMPKYVVLDPELTVSLPPQQTAASGMDALCHAVEAYINGTYNTKTERQMAVRTVKLIHGNLIKAYENGSDLEARQKLQEAAFCSGRAFARGGLGYACAMARPLSGLYGVSHGYASAILLPHVLRSYGAAAEKSLAELYDACGLAADNPAADSPAADSGNENGMHEKAEAFIRWIGQLNEKLGIPGYPDMIRPEDMDRIAEWTEEEIGMFSPVPVIRDRNELKELIGSIIPGCVKPEEDAKPEEDVKSESTELDTAEHSSEEECPSGAEHPSEADQPMIFDTHAHYDDEQFDSDRDELLGQMQAGGIGMIVNAGSTLESWDKIRKLTEDYPFVYGAIGIHPDDAGKLTEEDMERMKGLLDLPKIVAVGEIGLDYHWNKSGHDIQKKWFIRQLEIAREKEMPVIIHSREAGADTMEIMKEHASGMRAVIHCYSYSPEMAEEYVKMGYYIGVGGVVTFKNAKKLINVVKRIPLTSIVLETDCPYLAPTPYRGKRNSSLYLPHIAEKIAELKNVTAEEVVRQTTLNSRTLYGLNQPE